MSNTRKKKPRTAPPLPREVTRELRAYSRLLNLVWGCGANELSAVEVSRLMSRLETVAESFRVNLS